jgi:DNA-binding response OmpR family regulator
MSRILFIGPDVTSVSAAAALRAAGYDVSLGPNCTVAQEVASHTAPNLIIVRVALPSQTGLSNLRDARSSFGDVPILALVEGELTSDETELLLSCGATRTVVYSPFFPTLSGIVAGLLARSLPS